LFELRGALEHMTDLFELRGSLEQH